MVFHLFIATVAFRLSVCLVLGIGFRTQPMNLARIVTVAEGIILLSGKSVIQAERAAPNAPFCQV